MPAARTPATRSPHARKIAISAHMQPLTQTIEMEGANL